MTANHHNLQSTDEIPGTPTPSAERTMAELAQLVDGTLVGDPNLRINGASDIQNAVVGEITLANKPELISKLDQSSASAIVTNQDTKLDRPAILVDQVDSAFAKIIACFRPLRNFATQTNSPHASIDSTAILGTDVTVGANAVIGKDVSIGNRAIIHPGAVIMDGCSIGDDTEIFPNAVIYHDSQVGARCTIHAAAVIGAYGFGYDSSNGNHVRCAQYGNVVLGDDVEIGAATTIDRGTYAATRIGDGTKIDNQVMIGHNCQIGKHNLFCSQVGIAGSCSTGDYVVMAGQVGIGDHRHIGDQVVLGAKAGVMHDINEAGVYLGVPSYPLRETMMQFSAQRKLPGILKEFKAAQKKIAQLEEIVSKLAAENLECDSPAEANQHAEIDVQHAGDERHPTDQHPKFLDNRQVVIEVVTAEMSTVSESNDGDNAKVKGNNRDSSGENSAA